MWCTPCTLLQHNTNLCLDCSITTLLRIGNIITGSQPIPGHLSDRSTPPPPAIVIPRPVPIKGNAVSQTTRPLFVNGAPRPPMMGFNHAHMMGMGMLPMPMSHQHQHQHMMMHGSHPIHIPNGNGNGNASRNGNEQHGRIIGPPLPFPFMLPPPAYPLINNASNYGNGNGPDFAHNSPGSNFPPPDTTSM